LIGLVTGTLELVAALADGTVSVAGDPAILEHPVSPIASVDPGFDIVTP
jgi:hypothetical protein